MCASLESVLEKILKQSKTVLSVLALTFNSGLHFAFSNILLRTDKVLMLIQSSHFHSNPCLEPLGNVHYSNSVITPGLGAILEMYVK